MRTTIRTKTEQMMKLAITVAYLFFGMFWATSSVAQSSKDYARMGDESWIAFVCSTFASFAKDEANKSKLFDFGYMQGKRFLAAMASGKIEKRDLDSIPPFTLLFKGPSHDFVIGQTFAAAQATATEHLSAVMDNEYKEHRGDINTLTRQIASEAFKVRNCQYIVK